MSGSDAALLGLEGRTVVVSGAGGGGIGTSTCELLARAGAVVAGVDIEESELAVSEKAVVRAGGRFVPVVADANDPESAAGAIARIREAAPPLHGLVNIVGGVPKDAWARLVDYDVDGFDALVGFNLRTAFVMSQAVARALIDAGTPGSIVSLSSVSGSGASAKLTMSRTGRV